MRRNVCLLTGGFLVLSLAREFRGPTGELGKWPLSLLIFLLNFKRVSKSVMRTWVPLSWGD